MRPAQARRLDALNYQASSRAPPQVRTARVGSASTPQTSASVRVARDPPPCSPPRARPVKHPAGRTRFIHQHEDAVVLVQNLEFFLRLVVDSRSATCQDCAILRRQWRIVGCIAVRYFWMVAKISPGPLRVQVLHAIGALATSTTSPVSVGDGKLALQVLRSVMTMILNRRKVLSARICAREYHRERFTEP